MGEEEIPGKGGRKKAPRSMKRLQTKKDRFLLLKSKQGLETDYEWLVTTYYSIYLHFLFIEQTVHCNK